MFIENQGTPIGRRDCWLEVRIFQHRPKVLELITIAREEWLAIDRLTIHTWRLRVIDRSYGRQPLSLMAKDEWRRMLLANHARH